MILAGPVAALSAPRRSSRAPTAHRLVPEPRCCVRAVAEMPACPESKRPISREPDATAVSRGLCDLEAAAQLTSQPLDELQTRGSLPNRGQIEARTIVLHEQNEGFVLARQPDSNDALTG